MTPPPRRAALDAAVDALLRRLEPAASRASDAAARLRPFVALVADWNARTNLTAARSADDYAEILCADALLAAAVDVLPPRARMVDVGSGAGAPAIPIALLRDDVSGVLVEPLRKRVAFLRTAIGSLGLERRVRVVEGRLDPAQPSLPDGPFDVALSRATFAPALWVKAGAALAPRVLCFLGAEAFDPPEGIVVVARRDYALPSTGAPRTLLALAASTEGGRD